jgi:hypothetical protein
VSTGEL